MALHHHPIYSSSFGTTGTCQSDSSALSFRRYRQPPPPSMGSQFDHPPRSATTPAPVFLLHTQNNFCGRSLQSWSLPYTLGPTFLYQTSTQPIIFTPPLIEFTTNKTEQIGYYSHSSSILHTFEAVGNVVDVIHIPAFCGINIAHCIWKILKSCNVLGKQIFVVEVLHQPKLTIVDGKSNKVIWLQKG